MSDKCIESLSSPDKTKYPECPYCGCPHHPGKCCPEYAAISKSPYVTALQSKLSKAEADKAAICKLVISNCDYKLHEVETDFQHEGVLCCYDDVTEWCQEDCPKIREAMQNKG